MSGFDRKPQIITSTRVIHGRFTGMRRVTALGVYQTFVFLAEQAGSRDGRFEARRAEIAECAGVSIDTIDRYAKAFESLGLLTVERRQEGSVSLPNRWYVVGHEQVERTR